MAKRQKPEYPHFTEGTSVRLSGEILRYAVNGIPLEEPYVFVPDGEVGEVKQGLRFGNYLVRFPQATLHVYALRLTEQIPEPA